MNTRLVAGLSALILAALAAPLGAQTSPPARDSMAMPVPFGPGESAVYQFRLGIVPVGEGRLEVLAVDTVRGYPSYRLEMTVRGGVGFAKVDDRFTSWLDTRMLVSRRFIRDVHEVNYRSRRVFEIYPEEKRWERVDEDKEGRSSSILSLDEISFIYYLRTLQLQVGETITLERYFKEEGNPVVVRVLRKEVREVPAGTFNTIVVQPVIQTSGLFAEGGNAEVYLSDDEARHVVYLRSEIPFVGSMTLHLREVTEGTPLNPGTPRGPPRPAGSAR